MTMADETSRWKADIDRARRRREQLEPLWAEYARLHTNIYTVKPDLNDDALVTLPGGDQVKRGLVFRILEQAFAVTHIPMIGVQVEAQEFTRGLTELDTHREQVVEYALVKSARRSGLVKKTREADAILRDGYMIGHGICYSWWREAQKNVTLAQIPEMVDGPDGALIPALDEAGGSRFQPVTVHQTWWANVCDEHVPVREFLFSADAKSFDKASWHGREQVLSLKDVKNDARFTVPEDLKASPWEVRDIYGQTDEFSRIEDGVKLITIWDKRSQRLLYFIEAPHLDWTARSPRTNLLEVGNEDWPIEFSHPDDSPFSFFIPIPSTDNPFGISLVEHIRVSATEADKIESRGANQTRQAKTIMAYWKNQGVDEEQLQEAMNRPDRSIVGLDPQGDTETGLGDLSKVLHPITIPGAEPALFAQSDRAEQSVRNTSGISEVPWGGAGTATESENMMQVGAARQERRRELYLHFLSEVLAKHLDFLRRWAPAGQTATIFDPMSGEQIPLEYGREAFQGDFDITVLPGGTAMTMTPVERKSRIEELSLVATAFGPLPAAVMLRDYLARVDFRSAPQLLRAIYSQLGVLPPPGATPPGMDGRLRADAFNPNDQTQGQAIRSMVNPQER
jgi:hypothetical protein